MPHDRQIVGQGGGGAQLGGGGMKPRASGQSGGSPGGGTLGDPGILPVLSGNTGETPPTPPDAATCPDAACAFSTEPAGKATLADVC